MLQLIVGLGNPGEQYAKTRHNAGAWFVQALADRYNASFKAEPKFSGFSARIQHDDIDCQLLLPTTYMNRSGLSIQACCRFYKIEPDAVLVAHDDIDLPAGTVRLKLGGGHGGHNGLRDIIPQLGRDFYRLRFGVGRPDHSSQVIDYVLKPPSKIDQEKIDQAIDLALAEFALIYQGDMQKVMQNLHS